MENISQLVMQFRNAIESAQRNGETDKLEFFKRFPRGCCGNASNFLGHFLLQYGIETYYIWGSCRSSNIAEGSQTHAWLLLEDDTIIDITGDQFKDNAHFFNYSRPVYIGKTDEFHKLFNCETRNKRKSVPIEELYIMDSQMFSEMYNQIIKYL